MPADIVFSYSSRDRQRVLEVVEHLRGAGVSVWIDHGGIDGATLWSEEIVEAIEGSTVMILALSKASAGSANVVREVSLALERNKQILPLRLEEVDVPKTLRYPLAGIQHVDYFGAGADECIARVMRALNRSGVAAQETVKTGAAAAGAPVAEETMLAVLPFVNTSPDKESDYFSDGLTDELIMSLGRLDEISVVSRTNSMQYKGVKKDIGTIGRELAARYVLEGTVRRFQDDLRITANLIETKSSKQLWAEGFKGKMADVFDIQEDVAKRIVEALRVKLAPQDVAVLERHSTMNHEAYDTFLRARDFLFRLTKTNVQLAIRLYRKAIDLDPKFARAHAGLAEAFAVLYQLFERNEEYLDRASENAMKAIVFDPGVSEAYSALGLVYYNKGLLDEAHEAARRAVDLDPENILGYHDLAHVHITRDNLEGAAAALERILVLNPSFYAAFAHLRQVYERLGRAADASILSEREIAFYPVYLARHPDDARAHISFAVALAFAGQHEEARTECDSALELTPDDPLMLYNAACVYSRIGAPESALSVLAGAVAAGHAEYEWIKRDPDLDNIREHAGYIELMKGH